MACPGPLAPAAHKAAIQSLSGAVVSSAGSTGLNSLLSLLRGLWQEWFLMGCWTQTSDPHWLVARGPPAPPPSGPGYRAAGGSAAGFLREEGRGTQSRCGQAEIMLFCNLISEVAAGPCTTFQLLEASHWAWPKPRGRVTRR